jgi:PhzF family phenazine biosynthesis protein
MLAAMSATYRFSQLDVFTAIPTLGNALAVVHDAAGLSNDAMAAFARWTNLSETTFLVPPTDPAADYRVRIFTPTSELPFAGHPTLGSCAAWLAAGGLPKDAEIVQECGAGLVRLRRSDRGRLAFAAPPLEMRPVDGETLQRAAAALRVDPSRIIDAQWLVNGPAWLTLRLDSAEAVLALEQDNEAVAAVADIGAVGPWPPAGEFAFEVRGFAPADGVPEDPVTGSLNAGIAEWLIGGGVAPRSYVATQGARLGRAGRIHVAAEDDPARGATYWIGGDVTTVIEGTVRI